MHVRALVAACAAVVGSGTAGCAALNMHTGGGGGGGGGDASAPASTEAPSGLGPGDWGSPSPSAAETAALLDLRADAADTPSLAKQFVDCCGIDVVGHKVIVTRSMRSGWEADLKLLNAPATEDSILFRYARSCKTKPARFEIDIALQIDEQGNHAPYSEFLEYFANACGNPPNAENQAFIAKIKVVHFYLLTDPAARSGVPWFKVDLDKSTGTLNVGAYRDSKNPIGAWNQWLANQPS